MLCSANLAGLAYYAGLVSKRTFWDGRDASEGSGQRPHAVLIACCQAEASMLGLYIHTYIHTNICTCIHTYTTLHYITLHFTLHYYIHTCIHTDIYTITCTGARCPWVLEPRLQCHLKFQQIHFTRHHSWNDCSYEQGPGTPITEPRRGQVARHFARGDA